jgi:Flp pilus assembly protein TadG
MTFRGLFGRTMRSCGGLMPDCRGVSAVEFALIFPLMILLYLGGSELTQALAIKRLVALTSGTVTNLVAQYTTISSSTQMPDILNASAQVMTPYPAANATVVVTCITIDNNGGATVAWSQSLNGTARIVGSNITLPASLDTPNTTVILGETTYAYTPIYDFIHMGPVNLYSAVYMLPRASSTINLTS